MRDFASVLASKQAPSVDIVVGVVVATALGGSPPTISVQLSGDTTVTIPGVGFLAGYSPSVADNCLLFKRGTDLFAFGKIAT